MLKIADNTDKVTLWQFKMVINSGDVRYLLILDSYNELPVYDLEVLNTIWYEIYREFSESVGGNRADLWLLKHKTNAVMRLKHEIDASLLRIIKQFPHPELLEHAKEVGFNIDIEDFETSFTKARAKLVRTHNTIQANEKEMNKNKDNDEDLDSLIVALEKHQGYGFNEHEMTVKKFASIYKSFKVKQNG